MNLAIILLSGTLVGAGLGALYLGLLWLAVRHLSQDRGGLVVFVGLGAARLVLLLGSLFVAAALALPLEGVAAAVVGFIAVRFAATRMLGQESVEKLKWK